MLVNCKSCIEDRKKIGASAFREQFDKLIVSPQRPFSHQFLNSKPTLPPQSPLAFQHCTSVIIEFFGDTLIG